MKVAIVDDEQDVRELLSNLLRIHFDEVEVIGEASSVKEGLELIEQTKPDLLFLDIMMGDGTGFDLLKRLSQINFAVVFVTAYHEFALKAIKFSALDYLMKPIDPDELVSAVIKARNQNHRSAHGDSIKQLQVVSDDPLERIILKDASSVYLIKVAEIVRCEASDNYTIFHLNDSREIVISRPLKEYHELLADEGFFRTHQSHLINIRYFDRYNKKEGGFAVLQNGFSVPVANAKKEALLRALEELS